MSNVITEKKLQYLKGLFLHDSLEEKYPEFFVMIEALLQYLDENDNGQRENAFNILSNITDNIDAETMYSELLEEFYNQYFQILPSDKYIMPDEIKRKLIGFGKWINNSKGTRNILDFLFNYMQEFTTLDENGNVVTLVDLDYVLIAEERPFVYRVNVNRPAEDVRPFLDDSKPAGFGVLVRQAYTWGGPDSPLKVRPLQIAGSHRIKKKYTFSG